jgi:hypothetical protein
MTHPWANIKLDSLSWPVVDSTDVKSVKVTFNAASLAGGPEGIEVYDLFPVVKGGVLTTQTVLNRKPPVTATFPKSKLKVENPQDLSFELRAKTKSGKVYFATNTRDRVVETNALPLPELAYDAGVGGVRVKMAPFGMGINHYSVIARDEVTSEWLPEVLHDAPHPPRALKIDVNKTYTIRISGSTPSGLVVYRDALWPQGEFQVKKFAGLLEGKGEVHVPPPPPDLVAAITAAGAQSTSSPSSHTTTSGSTSDQDDQGGSSDDSSDDDSSDDDSSASSS